MEADYLHSKRYPFGFEDTLFRVRRFIMQELEQYPNFEGVDFCDVSAGGIQIRGHHKEVVGYSYGPQTTIRYDFINAMEAANQFVEGWKQHDEPVKVSGFNDFLNDGNTYGWD
jgi:hypothetical protein